MNEQLSTPALTRRDPALDGLRGVAVLLVYLFHYGGGLRSRNLLAHALGSLSQMSWAGVEIFFALSGFLITTLLLESLGQPGAVPSFYVRRALRILPLYLVAVALCGGIAVLFGATSSQLRPLWVYLGFVQNVPALLPIAVRTPPPLPLFHLWTVAVEEQFYLLWPLMLLLVRTPRKVFWLCLGVFVSSYVYRILHLAGGVSGAQVQLLAFSSASRCGGLALGSALAAFRWVHPCRALTPYALVILCLGLGTFLVSGQISRGYLLTTRAAFLIGLPAANLASTALLALVLEAGLLRSWLSSSPLGFMGRISYGFYVFHLLLEPAFDWIGAAVTHTTAGFAYQTVRLVAAFPITLCVAWFSFVLLERPFLRLKKHFRSQESPLAVPAASA